jgi:hypothetical protein
MDLVVFEDNKPFVLKALQNGDFDYMEAASEVVEADFFRFIKAKTLLDTLSQSYPTPRKKHDVPFWFYVAGNLSMRLHGAHAFDAFPLVVLSGGMLQAFGPKAGRKVVHPDTGIRRSCVRGLTGRITITGRLLVIRISCARWPRTPMPKR